MKNGKQFWFATVGVVICAVIAPLVLGSGNITVWMFAGFDALIVLGLSLLMGYTGQISIGQAAFFGIGAYSVAILSGKDHWPLAASMAIGIVLAAIVSLLMGGAIFRLSGHFLALGTLAFGYVVNAVMGQSQLTGGAVGISGIPVLSFLGHPFTSSSPVFSAYVIWGIVVICMIGFHLMLRSPAGMALHGIRDDEVAAASVGIGVLKYKLQVFAISAAIAALAGALYAPYLSYISAEPFGVGASIQFLLMAAIFGMSLLGAVVGAVAISFLGQGLTDLSTRFNGMNPGTLELFAYGLLLVVVMLISWDRLKLNAVLSSLLGRSPAS
ncbi:MAG: branched-chain amino acid ABC transporter permease [Candidatus Marsarchaeota archaeon]|nr:branched-chain amino acid ABC transporter permease [Candidatus Marsarchaeota archaeon]